MRLVDCEQGSLEWKQARAGLVTGSRLADCMSMTKKGEGADRARYRLQIVAEMLSGMPVEEMFVSAAMRWGTEHEDRAVEAYEIATGATAIRTGLWVVDADRFGASPDRLVDDDGVLEIKCPTTTTHVKWMLEGEVPEEHRLQIQGELWATGRQWCDFISFDPRLPPVHRLFVRRMKRDETMIEEIRQAVVAFMREADEMYTKLNGGE